MASADRSRGIGTLTRDLVVEVPQYDCDPRFNAVNSSVQLVYLMLPADFVLPKSERHIIIRSYLQSLRVSIQGRRCVALSVEPHLWVSSVYQLG